MSCYCDHYACTKELLDRFLTAVAKDRKGEAVGELVNDLYPNHGLLHCEINHKWEDIHRCLTLDTGEGLDFESGEGPLALCIHGGEWLIRVGKSYRTMTLLRAEQLPALCAALDGIDEEFFRRTMRELRAEGVLRYHDEGWTEQNVEAVWMDFRSLREFYHKANAARLPVVCTISH